MCRSLRVLCAAPDVERLSSLKRATAAAQWEVVGGATSVAGLAADLRSWTPDVVVVDGALGPEFFAAAREARPGARLVAVGGEVDGADAVAASLEDVRSAILGIPRPGGPVRA
jgi:hypothetical protein